MIIFTDLQPDVISWFFNENRDKFESISIMDVECSTMYLGIPKLYGVYPNFELISNEALVNYTEPIFDYEYGRYLDAQGFLTMMLIAGSEYYNGNRLYVYLIDRSEYRDSVIESLQKVLFIRYGISTAIVSSIEDLYSLDIDRSLSVQGLVQMGTDIERLTGIDSKLVERMMV